MMNTKGLGRNRRVQVSTGRLARLSLLAASIFSIQTTAFALQELSDQSLRQVDGQDGVVINTAYDSLHFDNLYWEDKAGAVGAAPASEVTLRSYVNTVDITGANQGATISVQTGSNGTSAGLNLGVVSRPSTMTAKQIKICDSGSDVGCAGTEPSLGDFTIQAPQNVVFNLQTSNGLFNSTGLAHVDLFLKNLNIFLTQAESAATSNQIILKDFNFNFSADGYMWVSGTNGLSLETRDVGNFVNLIRVTDPLYGAKTKPGLNIELMYKGGLTNPVSTYNLERAKGIIRLGASGKLTNSLINIRGVSTNNEPLATNILGFTYSGAGAASTGANATVIGSKGIVTRLKTDFIGTGVDQFLLELAHAGDNAYGIEFGKLTPLLVRKVAGGAVNPDNAYIDTGSVYMNLVNTQRLQLPANTVLNAARFGAGTLTNSSGTATLDDYSQLVHNTATNPNAFVLAIRGAEFQTLSRTGRFIVSNNVTDPADIPSSAGTWGIGLPIYNLNANLALFGTAPVAGEEKLGFSLGLTTQGVNSTGDKTTSILLIDGAPNANDANLPVNYYLGLRNIDMLIKAYGTISLKGNKININMPSFTIAAAAQVSAGYLPGAKYSTGAGYAPLDGFIKPDDVLFGLKLKLNGSANLDIVPATQDVPNLAQNRLSFNGTLTLTNSAIQLSDPIDGSILGLDNIQGTVNFSNQLKVNKASVDFNSSFDFSNGALQGTSNATIAASAFRVKDLNLYPLAGAGQRLGEFAMPGGTLTAKFNITPR